MHALNNNPVRERDGEREFAAGTWACWCGSPCMTIEIYRRDNEYLVFRTGQEPLEMSLDHHWKLIQSGADEKMMDDTHMMFEPSKLYHRILEEIDIGGHCIFSRRPSAQ